MGYFVVYRAIYPFSLTLHVDEAQYILFDAMLTPCKLTKLV